MAHVLFADLSQAGVHTLRRAVELGHRVTLVRGSAVRYYQVDDSLNRLLRRLDTVIDIPDSYDEEGLTTALRAVLDKRPVDAVICQFDPVTEPLAAACARLGVPWTAPRGVRTARDKARTRRALERAGLASARHAVVHDADAAVRAARRIGWPVVVKPVSGTDSLLTSRADGPADVREAADAFFAAADEDQPEVVRRIVARGLMVEEYLPGELVSAEIGLRGDRSWHFLVSGRSRGAVNDCVEMGAVLPADIPAAAAEECFAYAEAACRAMGLDFGVFHVEVMLTARGPVLVEVNPRVMGGVMTQLYRLLTGVDFCDHLLDVYLGREPRFAPVPSGGRTITARRLMPEADGRLPDTVDLDWVADPDVGLAHFESFHLAPGTAVRRQQVLGRFSVLADDWRSAMDRADALVGRFQDALGLPLIRSAPAGMGGGSPVTGHRLSG